MNESEFWVYSIGVCAASVCTSLSDEDATRKLNAYHPTGISSQWKISSEAFHTGETNPCTCNIDPSRRHILFSC